MTTCRLLVDPPATGSWNMAVDEVLLENAASGGWTLRFYAWSTPTLSLGYFQTCHDRDTHIASRGLPMVRRASGGGAIVHDQEVTYSLSGPTESVSSSAVQRRFSAVHAAWVEVLALLGVEANLCQSTWPGQPAVGPFLCFQRHTDGDVLVGGFKVAGSAQRRRQGAILQHGSVLLRTSAAAPELPGLADLAGVRSGAQVWIELALGPLSGSLKMHFDRRQLTLSEMARAENLVADRYGLPRWNERR